MFAQREWKIKMRHKIPAVCAVAPASQECKPALPRMTTPNDSTAVEQNSGFTAKTLVLPSPNERHRYQRLPMFMRRGALYPPHPARATLDVPLRPVPAVGGRSAVKRRLERHGHANRGRFIALVCLVSVGRAWILRCVRFLAFLAAKRRGVGLDCLRRRATVRRPTATCRAHLHR